MKKILTVVCMLMVSIAMMAQAQIKFEKTTHDFGKFNESDPIVKCTFTFTNTGDKPLVINQAVASCGCTVPTYTKTPVQPGEKGTINVTYNGTGKFPGLFRKVITVRSNAKTDTVRLTIQGDMQEEEAAEPAKK